MSGLGLRTAQWLAEQGARWLVLAGRSGASSEAAKNAVAALQARGVRVEVVRCDVADTAAVARLIKPTEGRPALRGVIHSAMVLHDELLTCIEPASLEKVLAPKVTGAWNLHLATRDLALDWFVLYSSVATLLGPVAQGSYVAANRFLDALAWHRRANGLPALALNWGPIADVGVVADNAALAQYLESVGMALLPLEDVFRYLKFLLRRDVTTLGLIRANWAKFRDSNPAARKSLRLQSVLELRPEASAGGSDALTQLLARAAAERPALLLAHLRRALAAVLRADEAALGPTVPLSGFGVDSLMAFEFKLRIDRDFKSNIPIDRLSANTTLTELTTLLLPTLTTAPEMPTSPVTPRDVPTPVPPPLEGGGSGPIEDGELQRVLTGSAASRVLEGLTIDAAALLYVPDRVSIVGGVTRDQYGGMFGQDPFVSHLYECSFGRIGTVSLPLGGKDLFESARLPELIRKAGELAKSHGARCISLTGLIPSATDYGRNVQDWLGGPTGLRVTTGHATTTAAVVLNLQSMLKRVDRHLGREHLAVLGLGSIGQSCRALLFEVVPHPRSLTLCDVFAKQDDVQALAQRLRERHAYRGPLRVLLAEGGLSDGLYEATTILTAVSVPDALDVERLRAGTILVDDSYPPAFSLDQAVRRAKANADLFFSNAGMVRLQQPLRETMFLPPGAEGAVSRVGADVFRRELVRDPHELTACILSALLTDRQEGMRATVGLADPADLLNHYHGLDRLGITAARPQCGTWFMPDELIDRFRSRFAAKPERRRAAVAGAS